MGKTPKELLEKYKHRFRNKPQTTYGQYRGGQKILNVWLPEDLHKFITMYAKLTNTSASGILRDYVSALKVMYERDSISKNHKTSPSTGG